MSLSYVQIVPRLLICIHTYVIDHYNTLVSNIDLVSHTTYVVCVNFMRKWRELQFKVDSEQHIFWETFHGSFLIYSQSFCQKSAERKSPKKYYFVDCFWCLAWGSNPGFTSNKSTHYLLDYSNFMKAFINLLMVNGHCRKSRTFFFCTKLLNKYK